MCGDRAAAGRRMFSCTELLKQPTITHETVAPVATRAYTASQGADSALWVALSNSQKAQVHTWGV